MSQEQIAALQAEVNRLKTDLAASKQDEGELIYVGQYLIERLVQLGVTVSRITRAVRW
jgi:hypothetical protein